MQKTYTLFLFTLLLLLMFPFMVHGAAQRGTVLPAKIRNHLNINYAGWKQTAEAMDCFAEFQRAVAVGDFDGNGKRDYVVKFIHKRSGYIVAFLATGTDYKPYVIKNSSESEIKNIGLNIGRKGESGRNEDGGTYRLLNDAPIIGECGSHANYYVYRNGGFRPL